MIYITEDQKKEWEEKIIDLRHPSSYDGDSSLAKEYENLLAKAIVLPTVEEWQPIVDVLYEAAEDCSLNNFLTTSYPNGVIIKP